MLSNFDFLKNNWQVFYANATEAEKHASTAPRTAAFYSRLTLEYLVNWMYDNDADYQRPYEDNLYALLKTRDFQDNIRRSIWNNMDYVRRIGNQGVHISQLPPTIEEATVALQFLHRVLIWFVRVYDDKSIRVNGFDKTLIPSASKLERTIQTLQREQAKLQAKEKALREKEAALERSEAEKKAVEAKLAAIKTKKAAAQDLALPPSGLSEAKTRELYLDAYLKEVGWNVQATNVKEFKVKGMPRATHPSGYGKADYVLWGDNGKPLAVIEAKRTTISADEGQFQAKAYADALEKSYGQRPVIFYSNGYDTFIWDDANGHRPRRLIGFYSKEDLQRLIIRRQLRKSLKAIKVEDRITDRYYQKTAIKRVCEELENEKKRGALLAMATGSGKTRTIISLVDVLSRQNWITRVLFLADRNALVKQAQRNFNALLPDIPTIDLTENKATESSRIVFSTYPTMMNQIDKGSGQDMMYSVGYFDLIIVDEAHRSVYNKYKAIFDYFDAVKVGLTATPKGEVHRDTYRLFDCPKDQPTYEYDLTKAIKDKHLSPPEAYKVPTLIYRDGLKYSELSDAEKEMYEDTFRDEASGVVPNEVEARVFINKLHNKPTILEMLNFLMDFGLKVNDDDKIGKTIIFARNHKHAKLIKSIFDEVYTDVDSDFMEVIDNYHANAQDAINRFSKKDKNPQIAVSVDMMDTGIDVPDILNLVFFKVVRSNSKYWQMVGRGTRLSENIFAPGKDKTCFYIFDFCGNIEYFEKNPKGAIDRKKTISITEKLFSHRLQLAFLLQNANQHDDLRQELLDHLHRLTKELDAKNPRFRMHAQQIEFYKNRNNWNTLTNEKVKELNKHIATLVPSEGKDHLAKRFDLVTLMTQIAILNDNELQVKKLTGHIQSMTKNLKQKQNINAVYQAMPVIEESQAEDFEKTATVEVVETIRKDLRNLLHYLKEEKDSQANVYTNFEDLIDVDLVEEADILKYVTTSENYKTRVERFIRTNRTHLTVHKLHTNQPITAYDLVALEQILFDGGERGTKDDFVKAYGEQPLGKFVRKIVGLDMNSAKKAFSTFLDSGQLTADQAEFLNTIINHLVEEGFIEKQKLAHSPYKEINHKGIVGVFSMPEAKKIVSILENINDNVG